MNNVKTTIYAPYIEERALLAASYIIETNCTIRECAKKIGVSKTTIHIDLSKRLKNIDLKLYKEVNKILQLNKAEAHLRGGLATSEKYYF